MRINDTALLEMADTLLERAEVKIHLKGEESSLLATASIIMGGIIEINGFTIRASKYEDLWTQPPKAGPHYNINCFFVNNPKTWSRVVKTIERNYLNALEERSIEETIEDIPF